MVRKQAAQRWLPGLGEPETVQKETGNQTESTTPKPNRRVGYVDHGSECLGNKI